MDRRQLLHALIMDAIANDYEPFATILQEVTSWAAERDLVVNRNEILTALMELVDSGFAAAYHLSPTSPQEVLTVTTLDSMSGCYFLLTPKGKAAMDDY